jgi:hypothetical protein
MNSYTDVGVAHTELLLVTCLRKETPLGNKNLLISVRLLYDSLLPLVPQNKVKVSHVEGMREYRGH